MTASSSTWSDCMRSSSTSELSSCAREYKRPSSPIVGYGSVVYPGGAYTRGFDGASWTGSLPRRNINVEPHPQQWADAMNPHCRYTDGGNLR